MPSGEVSEHPPAKVSVGQAHVTRVINAVMNGPNWKSSAIFLAWDDWGGFYDHVVPPKVDTMGYGIRVPRLFFLLTEIARPTMIVLSYSHSCGVWSIP